MSDREDNLAALIVGVPVVVTLFVWLPFWALLSWLGGGL